MLILSAARIQLITIGKLILKKLYSAGEAEVRGGYER